KQNSRPTCTRRFFVPTGQKQFMDDLKGNKRFTCTCRQR
ncbi:hypothetical protein D030_4911B, partial [Vibrio parahaemolyticus AQ3810]